MMIMILFFLYISGLVNLIVYFFSKNDLDLSSAVSLNS